MRSDSATPMRGAASYCGSIGSAATVVISVFRRARAARSGEPGRRCRCVMGATPFSPARRSERSPVSPAPRALRASTPSVCAISPVGGRRGANASSYRRFRATGVLVATHPRWPKRSMSSIGWRGRGGALPSASKSRLSKRGSRAPTSRRNARMHRTPAVAPSSVGCWVAARRRTGTGAARSASSVCRSRRPGPLRPAEHSRRSLRPSTAIVATAATPVSGSVRTGRGGANVPTSSSRRRPATGAARASTSVIARRFASSTSSRRPIGIIRRSRFRVANVVIGSTVDRARRRRCVASAPRRDARTAVIG